LITKLASIYRIGWAVDIAGYAYDLSIQNSILYKEVYVTLKSQFNFLLILLPRPALTERPV